MPSCSCSSETLATGGNTGAVRESTVARLNGWGRLPPLCLRAIGLTNLGTWRFTDAFRFLRAVFISVFAVTDPVGQRKTLERWEALTNKGGKKSGEDQGAIQKSFNANLGRRDGPE